MNFSTKNSEKGQMAILIALIFQVLFVLFAMIINVGLIVHDKINLQNSVDLAAFYAAQRQAEILNAIAHSNYQIRQAWKLLAWRTRVIGDFGKNNHPLRNGAQSLSYDDKTEIYSANDEEFPAVCISHDKWKGQGIQNLCKTTKIKIPKLPKGIMIAPFVPGMTSIVKNLDRYRGIFDKVCEGAGLRNYDMAIRWTAGFRFQAARSKKSIRTFADNLSASKTNFLDIHGESVRQGVEKTLKYNLTNANLDSSNLKFDLLNSLGEIPKENWLREIPIFPMVFYADLWKSGSCVGASKVITEAPKECNSGAAGGYCRQVEALAQEPDNPNELYHSIIGVEKNPWAMAYVGVKAETVPSKPFLPFGKSIKISATAFAKPFGGRIGPWMYKNWPRGSPKSNGNGPNDRPDPLLPIDLDPASVGTVDPKLAVFGVPNYSRFPGDTTGLRTMLGVSLLGEPITRSGQVDVDFYEHLPSEQDYLAASYNGKAATKASSYFNNQQVPWVREVELAAIAPDLFDITYYSVDANYQMNYVEPAKNGAGTVPENTDIGNLVSQQGFVNSEIQMKAANEIAPQTHAYYMVKKPEHLLTAWVPDNPGDYPPAVPQLFAQCDHWVQNKVDNAIPGMCPSGGRVGYSVKIVSRHYLMSDLELGGVAGGSGPILNPPTDF